MENLYPAVAGMLGGVTAGVLWTLWWIERAEARKQEREEKEKKFNDIRLDIIALQREVRAINEQLRVLQGGKL